MGLVKISGLPEVKGGILGVWELGEPCKSLLEDFQFSEKEKLEFNKLKNEKRKCEYLAVRLLLKKMMLSRHELNYQSSGKPFLDVDLNISISHSSELVVILLAETRVGVDVESLGRNTVQIASRYLSEAELQEVEKSNNPAFTRILYWSAKEALYKCAFLTGIDFKNNIQINSFRDTNESGHFTGQLSINNQITGFEFSFSTFKKNVIVYCIEKKI
jgi:phosphopantetheinyl transferase